MRGRAAGVSAAFCSSCGSVLGHDALRVSDERQERRVVTVLFADLAGSTALGERLDPEDFRELLGKLFDLITSEFERFGGTTEKYAGDAVRAASVLEPLGVDRHDWARSLEVAPYDARARDGDFLESGFLGLRGASAGKQCRDRRREHGSIDDLCLVAWCGFHS